MARLVVGDTVYESVGSASYAEAEFEQMLFQRAALLFPDYEMVEFKTTVQSDVGTAKADFALIEKRYRHWYVVEAEMSHHPFNGHVFPQVHKLSRARYGAPEAEYRAARGLLDQPQILDMMKGAQPTVLVVVNGYKPDWEAQLRNLGARVAVAEIFRSPENQHVVRLNGFYPVVRQSVLSECSVDEMIPRLLVVHSPAGLPVPNTGEIVIELDGAVTAWTRIDSASKVWLNPTRAAPHRPGERFLLVELAGGGLAFEHI